MSTTTIEETAATLEVSRFDAENATGHAVDFLKRLGYKGNWLPLKVSLEGEVYVVEMSLRNKTAKVQIDSASKDIKEYELQDSDTQSKSPLKSKALLFVIALVGIGVVASKLLGVF
jgi:hypothetical protein